MRALTRQTQAARPLCPRVWILRKERRSGYCDAALSSPIEASVVADALSVPQADPDTEAP